MLDFRKSSINSALRKVLKRLHYPLEVMLTCVRWYVAYPLSLRHIEEMMRERGVLWTTPQCTAGRSRWCRCWPPYFVGASTPLARVGGWTRPTSKWPASGSTFTGWLAALAIRWTSCSLPSAIWLLPGASWSAPSTCTTCQKRSLSAANTAAIESVKADACVDSLMCQCKYLNNIVEQDQRAIKRIARPIRGFKSFWRARIIIPGIESMHMIRKGRWTAPTVKPCLQPTSSTALQLDYQLSDTTLFG